MSGSTIHHLNIVGWKDALLARASTRIFAELFLGDDVKASFAASAIYDVIKRLRDFTDTLSYDLEVELENQPQFVQVFLHGFDVYYPATELQVKVLSPLTYTPELKSTGCELSVLEKPGFGTAIALTIPVADPQSKISAQDIKERIPRGRSADDILANETERLNAVRLAPATADLADSKPPAVYPLNQTGSVAGLDFIHEELKETRNNLKTAVQRYDSLVELKNNLRQQLEDLRKMLDGTNEPEGGIPGMLKASDIKDAVKQVASISAQLESHFRIADEAPAFDIEVNRFPVAEVFAALQGLFQSYAAAKNLDLQFELDPSVPELNTDKSRTVRVLHHLVDNALKFTEKGVVKVTAAKASHKGEVVFTVEDTGIGISQDHHRMIFGGDYESQKSGGSQFSGLPVAKELVKSLNGKIAVDSRVGEGSRFTIVLPVDFDAEPQIEPVIIPEDPGADTPPTAQDSADKNTSVLIIEDDEATQFLMKKILSTEYVCYGAASANEAFAILGKNNIRFIYMDIALRGSVDGIELTRQLRSSEEWKDIPIIALTSFTHDMTRGEALCAGCDDYLTKPINKAEVLEKVREYVRPYKPEALEFLK